MWAPRLEVRAKEHGRESGFDTGQTEHVFDDLIGSFFGWSAGSAIRRRRLRKRAERIRRGADFAVWDRSQAPGAPAWRTPRGSLRQSGRTSCRERVSQYVYI